MCGTVLREASSLARWGTRYTLRKLQDVRPRAQELGHVEASGRSAGWGQL